MKTTSKKTKPKKLSRAKTQKLSLSVDTVELAWMEKYAERHEVPLSSVFTSAARLFRDFTKERPVQVAAAMKGCGNPSHYSDIEEPARQAATSEEIAMGLADEKGTVKQPPPMQFPQGFDEPVPEGAVLLKADPLPTPTWELSAEETSAFMLVSLYVPKTGLDPVRDDARLEELLTGHESRDLFRRACEKLLARADSRQVMPSIERELTYLKERIHDAKGWLRLGMSTQLWGAITDGYAALDNGRVPPVKTWQKRLARVELENPKPQERELHERLERHFMENLSPLWPDDKDPLAARKALNLVCSYLLGITTPPLDLAELLRATPPSKFSPDFSEGGGVEKQAPLPPSVSGGSREDERTRDELKRPLGRGGME